MSDSFRCCLGFEAFACSRKTIQSNLNCVERFGLECGNGSFPHDSHSKSRGHNTTNIQGLPVKGRKKSSSVNTNNPVGSLSTQCCFIQSIIFRSRPEIFKALLNCYIFHRGNPKPLERLSAPDFVVHQSKDQLALTTGICCTHKTCNIFSGHELFQNPKLFFRTVRHLILPVHREDRKVCISPFAVLRIIGFRLCQFHQMPYTPADHISVSL